MYVADNIKDFACMFDSLSNCIKLFLSVKYNCEFFFSSCH